MTTLSDFSATTLSGDTASLSDYQGQVALVVNTASECGFTPQYAGLEKLHQDHAGDGLAVLGFPCNQFGEQEPGESGEIQEFCEANYGVTFPMFAKVDVNGPDEHPLFAWLKSGLRGMEDDAISWNFTKFLVGRDGQVIKRYGPNIEPAEIEGDIRSALVA